MRAKLRQNKLPLYISTTNRMRSLLSELITSSAPVIRLHLYLVYIVFFCFTFIRHHSFWQNGDRPCLWLFIELLWNNKKSCRKLGSRRNATPWPFFLFNAFVGTTTYLWMSSVYNCRKSFLKKKVLGNITFKRTNIICPKVFFNELDRNH